MTYIRRVIEITILPYQLAIFKENVKMLITQQISQNTQLTKGNENIAKKHNSLETNKKENEKLTKKCKMLSASMLKSANLMITRSLYQYLFVIYVSISFKWGVIFFLIIVQTDSMEGTKINPFDYNFADSIKKITEVSIFEKGRVSDFFHF